MNLFSFAGDLLHLASIIIILLKIFTLRSCKGQAQIQTNDSNSGLGHGVDVRALLEGAECV